MSVTLQLSRQQNVLSDGIAEWTRGWPSHVDIVWPDGRLLGARHDVCAGVPAGVQFRPEGYVPFIKTERISFGPSFAGVETAQEMSFYEFLMEQVGKPYDTFAVAGLALDRDWRKPNKWFCSELAVAALEHAKFIHPITSPFNFISPRDILLIGETCGAVVT